MRNRRKRNQVDFRHRNPLNLPGELLGVRPGIVHALYDGIFEGYDAFRFSRIGGARLQKFVDGPAPVYGHKFAAQFIVGRVERNGKFELDSLGRQTFETGHDAAG